MSCFDTAAAERQQTVSATRVNEGTVRVLIVDDSVVMRQLINRMLIDEANIEIIATARNGFEAISKIEQLHPDLVTLDIEMPELDGLCAMKIIRQRFPSTRVIMCSSLTERGAAITMDALLAGADDYVTKQCSGQMSEQAYDRLKSDLLNKIRHVTTSRLKSLKQPLAASMPIVKAGIESANQSQPVLLCKPKQTPQVLAIGVSTGGPTALAELLPAIPADFPIPVLIVQHMPPLFTQLLAERLARLAKLSVVEGQRGMEVKAGMAYLAPGNFHMQVVRKAGRVEIALNEEEAENSCRPAVDVLFRSVAEIYGGACIATILTGMGQDGLLGCRLLKQRGGSLIVQDKATSVVWGMPGAVAGANLADAILPLRQIVPNILELL